MTSNFVIMEDLLGRTYMEWKQKLSKAQKKKRAVEKSNSSIYLSDLGRCIVQLIDSDMEK